MKAPKESFDIDQLISLEKGVQREALEAFFRGITDTSDPEKWDEVVRFAFRAGWRVLPEILADDSPDFFKPIKRYVFAASCRALFWVTHPAADHTLYPLDDAVFNHINSVAANAADATLTAFKAASSNSAANAADVAHKAADAAKNKPLRQPLLLAMREDLVALQTNQTLGGLELWPKEAASLFDVNEWFGTFRKNLKRYERGREIIQIYRALLNGRIEQVIRKYPPDLFEDFFKSAESDYQEWQRGHTKDDKDGTDDNDSPEAPDDEEPSTEETKKSPRDTLHSEGPSGTDHLDRERLAEVLSDWLSKNEEHKAIGLFGDWGVGKSTFVNLLRKRLGIPLAGEAADGEKAPPDHYKTADYIGGEFNAWEYEHTDNIQAGLAQELIAALQANLSRREKIQLTWKFVLKYHRTIRFIWRFVHKYQWVNRLIAAFAKRHWVNWLIAAFAIVAFIFVVSQLVFPTWFSGLVSIGGLIVAWRYGSKAVAHPLAKELHTYLRLPSFGKELGTIPVMREQVKAMVHLRLGFFKQQRLLFVVDDLDRCSPEAVVKVLEAVRLIMDLPNVVVLIAIDQKIALASLALRYKELAVHYGANPKSIARQYLGKVIHVPITLENPAPEAVENYLKQKLWSADDASVTSIQKISPKDEPGDSDGAQSSKAAKSKTSPASPVDNDPPANSEPGKETSETLQTPERPESPAESSTHAKSSDSETMQAQTGIKSIGLNEGQKDTFISWAKKLGLANPRHIKRLDNAYNLIRLRYPDEDGNGEPYYRLVMLIWIEYSRELPLDTYAAFRNYVRSETAGEPDDTVKNLRDCLNNYDKEVGLFWDEVKAVWNENAGGTSPEKIRKDMNSAYQEVRTFVLPAIEKDPISRQNSTTKAERLKDTSCQTQL